MQERDEDIDSILSLFFYSSEKFEVVFIVSVDEGKDKVKTIFF